MGTPVYPYVESVKLTSELPKPVQSLSGNLTESQLDDLDWARRFMRDYERKTKFKKEIEDFNRFMDKYER